MKKIIDVLETVVEILSALLPVLEKKTKKPSDEPTKSVE